MKASLSKAAISFSAFLTTLILGFSPASAQGNTAFTSALQRLHSCIGSERRDYTISGDTISVIGSMSRVQAPLSQLAVRTETDGQGIFDIIFVCKNDPNSACITGGDSSVMDFVIDARTGCTLNEAQNLVQIFSAWTTDKGGLPFRAGPPKKEGPYSFSVEGDTIWVYNHTSKQAICHVDYSVPNGGSFSNDSRSVIIKANSRADSGVGGGAQISGFKLSGCHPWTIQNPLGR